MRLSTPTRLLSAALVGLAALAGARDARAGFTVVLDSTSPSGANTAFNYSASISPDDQIVSGDFFRVYDFAGLVGTPTAPANWTVTVENTDAVPPPNVVLTRGDDPAVPNLTWTYTGTSPLSTSSPITGFSAVSTFGFSGTLKDFVGQNTQASGPTAGTKVSAIGAIRVPGVPEPSGVVSAALGVIGLGAAYAVRRRRDVRARAQAA